MYQWFVVVGSLFSFLYGFGTGSNDVANAFATSVGSKTLSMGQAILIASVFEFVGAIVLGRVSTSTIQGGVADISQYKNDPEMYAYGMMIALGVAGFLQVLGSYMELNISSTHSIIGCIMGFSLVLKGKDGVLWAVKDNNSFPPYKGVVPIFFSWVISPLLTGIASAIIFGLCKYLVLRRQNSVVKSAVVLPFAVFLTTWINVFFVFTKGAKKMLDTQDDWSDHKAAVVALYAAIASSGLSAIVGVPWILYKVKRKFEDTEDVSVEMGLPSPPTDKTEMTEEPEVDVEKSEKLYGKFSKFIKGKIAVDVDEVIEEDPIVAEIHKNAEVFDSKSEFVFSFLQVFSAICVIFSHGAGEVGYMAGPLAAIWDFVDKGTVSKKVTPPIWIVLIGAFGLIFGLSLYGQKVTKAMAMKLSKLSPTRGFAAELATAMVIMVAAQFGLPTSSSQCIIGGIVGVGLMEGIKGVNWKFFASQFMSWVVNLFLSLGLVAAFFSQGVFSPSVYQGRDVHVFEKQVSYVAKDLIKTCNSTRLSIISKQIDALAKVPYSTPLQYVSSLNATLAFYKNNTC